MEVIEHLAYGRGILLAVFITGVFVYFLLKNKQN